MKLLPEKESSNCVADLNLISHKNNKIDDDNQPHSTITIKPKFIAIDNGFHFF